MPDIQNMRTASSHEDALRQALHQLSEHHELVAIKTGTEIEDMDDEEIEILRRLSLEENSRRYRSAGRLLPLVVKIGGPEARRDMRMCLRLGVDCILAPMVESVYALDNFVETTRELCKSTIGRYPLRLGENPEAWRPSLAINLETSSAADCFAAMLSSASADWLSQVTVGRGDLSRSMHLDVDNPAVMEVTNTMLDMSRHQGIATSVGGGITNANIGTMAHELRSDRFNTRHMVFANSANFRASPQSHLSEGLRFELELYRYLATRFPGKRDAYLERVRVLEQRLTA